MKATRNRIGGALAGLCAFAMFASPAAAPPALGQQPAPPPAPGQAQPAPPGRGAPDASGVTRLDLGRAYLKFDRAVQAKPLPKDQVADANKAFDSATLLFFKGKFADAVRGVNEAAEAVDGETTPGRRFADALKAEVSPAVANAEAGKPIKIHLRLMYKLDLAAPAALGGSAANSARSEPSSPPPAGVPAGAPAGADPPDAASNSDKNEPTKKSKSKTSDATKSEDKKIHPKKSEDKKSEDNKTPPKNSAPEKSDEEKPVPAVGFAMGLRLVGGVNGAVPLQTDLALALDSPPDWTQDLEFPTPAAGVYRIEALPLGGGPVELGRVVVAPASLDAARAENKAKLDALKPEGEALQEAARIARARNELLTDSPSEKNSTTLLFDPNDLLKAIRAEIAAIAEGRDPYAGQAGDVWRVLPMTASASQDIPYRLFVPAEAIADGRKAPLVIALHGAGGDENMFIDAYGAGEITKQAKRKGFIVASPATSLFGRAGALDALIRSVGGDFAIDYERIYVIGHSMGGGVAMSLADKNPDTLAGAVGIAPAAKPFTSQRIVPTLLIAGSLDPIVPVERIKPVAEAAKAAGLPVEYRELENYGHTLMVPKALPDAIDWLFERKLTK